MPFIRSRSPRWGILNRLFKNSHEAHCKSPSGERDGEYLGCRTKRDGFWFVSVLHLKLGQKLKRAPQLGALEETEFWERFKPNQRRHVRYLPCLSSHLNCRLHHRWKKHKCSRRRCCQGHFKAGEVRRSCEGKKNNTHTR